MLKNKRQEIAAVFAVEGLTLPDPRRIVDLVLGGDGHGALPAVEGTVDHVAQHLAADLRPIAHSGSTIKSSRTIMTLASQALVTNIIAIPPNNISALRSAIDMLEPTKV